MENTQADSVIDQVRHYLVQIEDRLALDLLDRATETASSNAAFRADMDSVFLHGSTVELRALMSPFGRYNEQESDTMPRYPHTDAVHGIDSALLAVRHPESLRDSIDFVRLMAHLPPLQGEQAMTAPT